MFRNVFLKSMYDQRRSMLFWGLSMVLLALIMTLLYPSMGAASYGQYIEQLPEGFMELFTGGASLDFSTPVGFFNTELFSLMLPLLFIVFGIGLGTGAVAGEEDKGTLNFVLSLPIARRLFLLQKIGMIVVHMLVLGLISWVGLAIGIVSVDIDLSLLRTAEATLAALLLAMVFSSLALTLGCWRGSKGLAIGLSGGLAVLTYLLHALGTVIDWLEPYRVLSPFYHYVAPDTLSRGFDAVHILVLVALVLVFLTASFPLFERRDIAV